METYYAEALILVIEKGEKPAEAVRKLRELLEKEGRSSLLPKIATAYRRLARRHETARRMTITIARASDEHEMRNRAQEALLDSMTDAGNIETVIDPSIVGGWRLEGRETLIDRSYKARLLGIFTSVTA